jgi:hypothetical protein
VKNAEKKVLILFVLNRGKNCQSGVSDSAKQMIPTFQKIFETKKEKIKFKLKFYPPPPPPPQKKIIISSSKQ